MIEIRFTGHPVYQLKVRDLTNEGAGIVVRLDSDLLKMIEVGQELNVRLVLQGITGGHRAISNQK
jgi:hypothetical protein